MKIIPTLEGGLRIEVEDAADWWLLHAIAGDAAHDGGSLAAELGAWVQHPELKDDWQEFVIPDLEREFSDAIEHLIRRVRSAEARALDGRGELRITPQDAGLWFSALNQARLALEARFHLSDREALDPADLEPVERAAFIRSQLYGAIQQQLLDHVMR